MVGQVLVKGYLGGQVAAWHKVQREAEELKLSLNVWKAFNLLWNFPAFYSKAGKRHTGIHSMEYKCEIKVAGKVMYFCCLSTEFLKERQKLTVLVC